MENNLTSVSEAAKKLKVSTVQVRSLIKSNKLDGIMVGKQWVIKQDSIARLLQSKEYLHTIPDRKFCGKSNELVALSFFTGAGGLDIGMSNVGIKPQLVCENDKSSRLTIERNNAIPALIGDIEKYTSNDILAMAGLDKSRQVDIIFGGPPCQAFSTAGKRRGFSDTRGNVFLKYLDIITEILPKYAIFENVRGILSAPYPLVDKNLNIISEKPVKGGALLYVINKLKFFGYKVSFELYNSANFGAPQLRERVVIIAYHGEKKVPYLEPSHDEQCRFGLQKWRTLGDVIKKIDSEAIHHYVTFPEKRLKYYRILKEGQNWRNLPRELQEEALGGAYLLGGGKTGFFRRLSFDKPCPTLVTHPAMPATDLAHPLYDRPLSVEEYKAIQEFPEYWEVCGSLLDQYRQLGNAVPVKLGEAIGNTILKHKNNIDTKKISCFPYSRYKRTSDVEWLCDIEKVISHDFKNVQMRLY